MILIEIWYHWK